MHTKMILQNPLYIFLGVAFYLINSCNMLHSQDLKPLDTEEGFRGVVTSTTYNIPLKVMEQSIKVKEINGDILKFKIGDTVRYEICADSLYHKSELDDGSVLELYQINNKTFLFLSALAQNDEGRVFVEYPKIKHLLEGVRQKDWKYYKSKWMPFNFNYRLQNTYRMEHEVFAYVDENHKDDFHYQLGGRYLDLFNHNGRYIYYGGVYNDSLVVSHFNYFHDSTFDCRESFSRLDTIGRTVSEIPQNTVSYEPDTLIDFENQFNFLEFLTLSNKDSDVLTGPFLPNHYNYVELYSANTTNWLMQREYLKDLFTNNSYPDLGIVSICVETIHDYDAKLPDYVNLWPHYWALDGRSPENTSKYNLWLLPRYLIVDYRGNIIMLNAPRPSDIRLGDVLKQLAKQ